MGKTTAVGLRLACLLLSISVVGLGCADIHYQGSPFANTEPDEEEVLEEEPDPIPPECEVIGGVVDGEELGSILKVRPLSTVQLYPMASERGEWVVLHSPESSTAWLEEAGGTSYFLDVVGEYVFRYSSPDLEHCPNRNVTVSVVPPDGIHIELTWDQNADLDLHLLHPRGEWFDPVLDNHFANKSPVWDERSHPSLDLDDTNGFGPENIRFEDPLPLDYRLGVGMFSSDVSSTAYIRLFLDGVLVLNTSRRLQACLDTTCEMWEIARVNSWDGRIEMVDEVYEVERSN